MYAKTQQWYLMAWPQEHPETCTAHAASITWSDNGGNRSKWVDSSGMVDDQELYSSIDSVS